MCLVAGEHTGLLDIFSEINQLLIPIIQADLTSAAYHNKWYPESSTTILYCGDIKTLSW